ncbi:guanylyl cyclase [Aphelenchoides avenae]|nr:guanylyl cyclase [Aphelenchus avenae]
MCFTFFLFTVLLYKQVFVSDAQQTIHIGLLMSEGVSDIEYYVDFKTSIGALTVGFDRVWNEQLLPGVNFTVTWYFDQCDESRSIAFESQLLKDDKVDVIIGPTCSGAIMTSAVLAKYHNIPLYVWGPMASTDLDDRERFPTVTLNVGTAWT